MIVEESCETGGSFLSIDSYTNEFQARQSEQHGSRHIGTHIGTLPGSVSGEGAVAFLGSRRSAADRLWRGT